MGKMQEKKIQGPDTSCNDGARSEYKYKYSSQEEEENTRGERINETYQVLAEVRVRSALRGILQVQGIRFR